MALDIGQIASSLQRLSRKKLLIGVTQDRNPRKNEPIGNAALGYIHERGSPAQNIPPRPHIVPGVQDAVPDIKALLQKAALAALHGDDGAVDQYLVSAGQLGADKIRLRIDQVLKPPIQPKSLLSRVVGRSRRKRQLRRELAEAFPGIPPGERIQMGRRYGITYIEQARAEAPGATPLYDTGQYKAAIHFVIRDEP